MKSRDETTPVWTLPNRLSLVRILFIPAILYLISMQNERFRFVLCILLVIGDHRTATNGLIARRMSMKTRLGEFTSTPADKLLICDVLIAAFLLRARAPVG